MKRYCAIISLALLTGLLLYLVYRTDRTIVNILLDKLTHGRSHDIRIILRKKIPLPGFIIFSLPEGLWVFSATLVSKHLYCGIKGVRLHLSWLPLFYAVLLEGLQWLHLMPGRFDIMDLSLSALFTIWALKGINCPLPEQDVFRQVNYRTFSLVYIYGIVFLSHVSV